METEQFLRDARRVARESAVRSPTYASLLEAIVARGESGPPPWFADLERAWEGRRFTAPYEAPSLLLHSIHAQALRGAAPELRGAFPSCGGKAGPRENSKVLRFLDAAPDSFWEGLRRARLQTNDVLRSVGWLLVGSAAFRPRGTPFHLVDLGCSAGLNLIGDYLPREWSLVFEDGRPAAAPPRWEDSPFAVLSRIGLDRAPVDLSDPEQRLWLKACLGPDHADDHARFDGAADLFLRLRSDPTGPRLHACRFSDAAEFLSKTVRPHDEEGLLIYNSQAADFLGDDEYAALESSLAAALAPWGDRGFWAELEMSRRTRARPHRLAVHRLINGGFQSKTLAELTEKPGEVKILPGWDFLEPFGPVRLPRNTREERPGPIQPGLYTFPKN